MSEKILQNGEKPLGGATELTCDKSTCGHLDVPGELIAELFDELHAIADQIFRRERPGHTLQATTLVTELWLRVAGSENGRTPSREQFLAFAANVMRHILADHARTKLAFKRNGNLKRCSLGDPACFRCDLAWAESFLELDDEMKVLEKAHARSARVFEMRYFGGMDPKQIAAMLGVSDRTVRNDWKFACAWMKSRIIDDDEITTDAKSS